MASAHSTGAPGTFSEIAPSNDPFQKLQRLIALFYTYFSVHSNQRSYPGQFILRLVDSAINTLETQLGYKGTPVQNASNHEVCYPSRSDK